MVIGYGVWYVFVMLLVLVFSLLCYFCNFCYWIRINFFGLFGVIFAILLLNPDNLVLLFCCIFYFILIDSNGWPAGVVGYGCNHWGYLMGF